MGIDDIVGGVGHDAMDIDNDVGAQQLPPEIGAAAIGNARL
jgi:hypothetical protein